MLRIFPCIVAFAAVANGQSDTSCLLQGRDKAAERFSAKQERHSFDEPLLNPSPSALDQNFIKGDRLPICITGQIGRVELRTKIQHLIQPAVDEGHRVEVYLVLDPRPEPTFIHRPPGTEVGNYTIVGGNFTTLNETVSLFPREVPVILDPYIPQDYPTDERYANLLIKSNEAGNAMIKSVGKLEWAKKRAKSHMRQWEMFARCWELFQKTDAAPPKVAVRIRDDLVFVAPFKPNFETLGTGIHVDSCEGCGGLNDKLALLSGPGVIASYFTQPLPLMRDDFSKILAQRTPTINPESVLYNIMQLSKIKTHSLDVPCYRATMMRDSQSQVHLCYFYSMNTWSCFHKIWPHLKDRTTPVFASKQTTSQAPKPIFLQHRAARRAKPRHWAADVVARRSVRFQEQYLKMMSSANRVRMADSTRRQLQSHHKELPAYVCER